MCILARFSEIMLLIHFRDIQLKALKILVKNSSTKLKMLKQFSDEWPIHTTIRTLKLMQRYLFNIQGERMGTKVSPGTSSFRIYELAIYDAYLACIKVSRNIFLIQFSYATQEGGFLLRDTTRGHPCMGQR